MGVVAVGELAYNSRKYRARGWTAICMGAIPTVTSNLA